MARLALAVILLAVHLASDGITDDRTPAASKPDASSDKAVIDRDANGLFNELLSVAGQLEQAGRNEEAAKVRKEARNLALKSNLLARKESELEVLQKEVDRIRKVTGKSQTVLIQATAIEVRRSKLGNKADEFDRLFTLRDKREAGRDEDDQHAAGTNSESAPDKSSIDLKSPLFEELKRRQAVAFIAEPTLITSSHRPASFLSGGQFPVPTGPKHPDGKPAVVWKTFGVHLDVVPAVLSGGRIHLQAKLELSEKDNRTPIVVEGLEIPILLTRSVTTEIEIQSGQTVLVGCMRSTRYPSKPPEEDSGTGKDVEPVKLVGTNSDGNSSLSGTIVLLTDELPNQGEETELFVLLTAELVSPPNSK